MTRRLSLRRRRADPAPVVPAPSAPEPVAPAPAAPEGSVALPLPVETTALHTPVVLPAAAAPAGLEPQPVAAPPAPSFRDRGRLRRRLRYLRRVRELGFRDLGGLVFDLHRFGREGGTLVAGKLEALTSVDVELRALEDRLQDRRDLTVLREPGIAACLRCGALHGSDANFCPNCGLSLDGGPQAMSEVGDAPAAAQTRPLPPAVPVGGAAAPATAPAADGGSVHAEAAPIFSGFEPAPEQPTTVQPAVDAQEQPTTVQPAAEPGPGTGSSSAP